MAPMFLTADTSQFDRSWLKADASENMRAMSVTCDMGHFDRSWLNSGARENMDAILVMADTSQSQIDLWCGGPSAQSPIGDVLIHSLTAAWRCSSFPGLYAALARVRK